MKLVYMVFKASEYIFSLTKKERKKLYD